MASLVAAADWPKYTPVPPPGNAQALLDASSSLIRGHCGWSISREVDVDLVLDGNGRGVLLLPTLKLEAAAVTVDERLLVDGLDYEWSAAGMLRRLCHVWPDGYRSQGVWPRRFRSVGAVITHGHDPVPTEIQELCTVVAARVVTPAGASPGMKAETIGSYSYTAGASVPGSMILEPPELTILDRYQVKAGR